MIHDDPIDPNPYTRSRFEQLRRFLNSRGAPVSTYRIAHVSRRESGDADADAIMVSDYSQERFRGGSQMATLSWPTPSGVARIRTGLLDANSMIAFAFDMGKNLAMLTGLPADTDPAIAASMLALDRSVLKRYVSAFDAGSYVAPDAGGWAYFLVEPYGQVVVLADSPQATPMLQMLASDNLQQAQNLAGRMAEFMVPIAPEDSAD